MYKKNILNRILGKMLWKLAPYIKDDKFYLKIKFRNQLGYSLDLKHPKSFNEKLQWLKLNNQRADFTKMVDKIAAKDYVASIIGKEYIIPTLAIYNNADEIDFDKLPDKFVLKCTHDSGGIIVCNDKSILDLTKAKRKLSKDLSRQYYAFSREYPYLSVPRKIIAEPYLVDESGLELKDYKFFCFNGEPMFFKIDFDRSNRHKANYYDLDWNLLPFYEAKFPSDSNRHFKKPVNFEKMIEISRELSRGIPFVRIDLYNVNGVILFGEITFFPASGLGEIIPHEWDFKLGSMIKLPIDYSE